MMRNPYSCVVILVGLYLSITITARASEFSFSALVLRDIRPKDTAWKILANINLLGCGGNCLITPECKSFYYGDGECGLLQSTYPADQTMLQNAIGFEYYYFMTRRFVDPPSLDPIAARSLSSGSPPTTTALQSITANTTFRPPQTTGLLTDELLTTRSKTETSQTTTETTSSTTDDAISSEIVIPTESKVLLFTDTLLTLNDAETECKEKGGQLPSIHSKEENDLLVDLVKEHGVFDKDFWIGLQSEGKDGKFVWADETEIFYSSDEADRKGYQNWCKNDPDGYMNGFVATRMNIRKSGWGLGCWIDYVPTKTAKNYYFCKIAN